MASRVCPWRRSSQARSRMASRLGDGRSLGGARPKSWSRLGCWAKSRTNERIDSTRQVKAFGHFVSGEVLQKIGPANLVVPLGGGVGVLEQGGKCGRTCRGSWGWRRQGGGCPTPVAAAFSDRGREPPDAPERAGKMPPPRTADRDAASQAKVKNTAGPAGKLPNGSPGGRRGSGEKREKVRNGSYEKVGGQQES